VKRNRYIPERGDIVWLDFDPQAGHEQAGRRPAFVLSPAAYNGKTGLMLCCPITSQVKGYPFEVAVEGVTKARGVILADQVKSLDWQVRRAEKLGKVTKPVLEEVIDKVRAILEG
jgi:mRNA interferase MazF